MATNTPLNSETSTLPKSSSGEHGLCLSYDQVVKELPLFLLPSDGQEQKDLAMFLSQLDVLHKPVTGKLNARFVFNFIEHMLKPSTHITEKPKEVTVPEQLQEPTENIAFKIANSVISDFDLHNATVSVLNEMQEVSWEAKVALSITTFLLTFGDNGFNLCEEPKVSFNEVQLFANLKDGYKHHLDDNDSLFMIIINLIHSIVEFEMLPATYMTSKDPKVKVARTHLIVVVYWIIRIIVAASASHIMKLSSRRNEFDKAISALWEVAALWSKKLKELRDKDNLKAILSQLKYLLKEDVDIKEYNRIKETIEQGNHEDNMKVLNVLLPSRDGDLHLLYDCLYKRKVHLNELKGSHVLLYISSLENIAPEDEESKLIKFIDSLNQESKKEVECKLVWMPIDKDHSLQRKEATNKFTMKPLLDFCYMIHQKLSWVVDNDSEKQNNIVDWYSIRNPSEITNEVKRFIRDDWKYKSEPMIVVLDPQGNVIHYNAIHMIYIWGFKAFPFNNAWEKHLWTSVSCRAWEPIRVGLRQFNDDWDRNNEYIFYFGGENMEWIRSFTGLVREVARELGFPINMVYVAKSHNQELMRSVKEENLSHCLSDRFYIWLFWKRLESIIYSGVYSGRYNDSSGNREYVQNFQGLINYDKSNVGWAILHTGSRAHHYYPHRGVGHGKVVLSTLKEFKLWKEKALNNKDMFQNAYQSHYKELYNKIISCKCLEFPTDALKQTPLETMLKCPDCGNHMQQYTTFICYHASSTNIEGHE